MEDQKQQEAAEAVQQSKVNDLLNALPGLVGAIDRAIIEQSGLKAPFVLVIFAEDSAMHATNITPPQQAQQAIIQLADAWRNEEEPTAHQPI